MRNLLLLAVFILSACASNPSSSIRNSGNFDPIEAAKTRVSLGLTYLKNGNYPQAKINLDKAVEFAPRLADAHYSLGYYYQVVGENALANEAYELAMDLAPRNADIANSYGAFLCQQGKYEQAKDYFLKAVNSSNYASTAESYENLALCSNSQGRVGDGIEYLRLALNHQPTRAKSLMLLAEMLASEGQWDEAKELLGRYERVARVTPESLWLTIKIEQALGNIQKARGYGDMLIRMYPEHPNTQAYISKRGEQNSNPIPEVQSKRIVKVTPTPASDPVEGPKAPEPAEVPEPTVEKNTVAASSTVSEAVITETSDSGESSVYHVVQKNENLYRISLRYNIKMQRLIDWNNLDDASSIYAGMKLFVVDPQTIE